jgi:hypothetical protein
MSDYSLGSRAVYAAQRYSRELVESVWSGWFYDHLLDVLKNDTWREYSTEAFGRPCRFDDLRDFLAHEDGLGWPSVDETLAMIEAVRDCPQDLPPEKNAPVGRLQEWAKDALLGLERCGVTRMTGAASRAQPLAPHGEIGNGRADESRVDLIKSTQGGTSQRYLLQRLARDCPEILERVKTGEFKSARAAAIEAGIIKPVPSVRLVDDADQIADSIVAKLGKDRAMAVAVALAELLRDVGAKP